MTQQYKYAWSMHEVCMKVKIENILIIKCLNFSFYSISSLEPNFFCAKI
jgi:hypothetical protein